MGKSFTIRMMSVLAEKILRQPGQNPNNPVCILAAPTGKAASIIGIDDFFQNIYKSWAYLLN